MLTRKSLRELWRHRFRSALAVVTIAATVMGLWLLAVPRGFDAAMIERAGSDRLHHLRLSPSSFYSEDPEYPPAPGTKLDAAAIDALRALDNVASVDVRPAMYTQMRSGGRTRDIWLVGVEDFADQEVNVVRLADGEVPRPYPGNRLEALTDTANAATGLYDGAVGDEIEIMAGDRNFYPFTVTGSAGTIGWSAAGDGPAHFFVPADTVRLFRGGSAAAGFNSIEILLVDGSANAAAATLQEAKAVLAAAAPAMAYERAAEIRAQGSWPGRENVTNLLPLLYVVIAVAVLAALILLATTMNTIVRQQTAEIGILKALGASRRTIGRAYVTTALALGGAGTLLGTGVGIVVGNALAGAIQDRLLGFDPAWRIDGVVGLVGMAVGLAGSALAAVPALRRALQLSVRGALDGRGPDGAGSLLGRIGRGRRRLPALTALGLRNFGRRAGRSASASVQVGLGAAVALALGSFAVTGITVTNDTMDHQGSDIAVSATRGVLDSRLEAVVEDVAGVAAVQPIVYAGVAVAGQDRAARGLPADPIYQPSLAAGRWFTAAEVEGAASVVVVGEALASTAGVGVGDSIDVGLKDVVGVVEVVGIDSTLVDDGKYVLLPITTLMEMTGNATPSAYWVETVSPDHEVVDSAVADIEAAFRRHGIEAGVAARYPDIEAAQAEDRIVVAVIQAMGLPILAIGMIGLVGAMSSNVLERRREIGVLRAVGAGRRHLRRIFRVEGLAIALAGWALAVPVGFALGWLIVARFADALGIRIDLVFPVWLPVVVLMGVLAISALSMRVPLRGVLKMRPGDAIRYE
jgi:putative ABC transport system permease protein